MRFSFNINKRHVIVILLLLVVSGLGIAQTPNPGHDIDEIEIDPAIGGTTNIRALLTNLASVSNTHSLQINGLLNYRKWTEIEYPSSSTSLNLCSTASGSLCKHTWPVTHSILFGAVPSTAKEVLVYAWMSGGTVPAPTGDDHVYFKISSFTDYQGSIATKQYTHRFLATSGNSDTFWLPIDSRPGLNGFEIQIVVAGTGSGSGGSITGYTNGMRIIGYR